jgi:hypothetical protein
MKQTLEGRLFRPDVEELLTERLVLLANRGIIKKENHPYVDDRM